jgi:ATP-dependent helicase/nuclease subunit B
VLLLAGILRAADLLTDAGLTGGAPVATETDGARLVGDTGVTLRGRPDRIDRRPDGRLFLIDYKKGSPPSATDQKNVDRQLQLLAAMAAAGAFCPAPEGVAGAAYVALGKGGVVGPVDTGPEALSEVWDWLVQRVERMLDPATGFTARRSGVVDLRGADYAHLSRHGEWQMSDRPVAEDMA